ncbi:hypothetical protein A2U01_0083417, partial [Trifolium medium]|nr:hypothetical protein [Trifolium medium]
MHNFQRIFLLVPDSMARRATCHAHRAASRGHMLHPDFAGATRHTTRRAAQKAERNPVSMD